MFPYVCISTMPLFCGENWPRKLKYLVIRIPSEEPSPSNVCIYKRDKEDISSNKKIDKRVKWKHKLVVALIIVYCGVQIFLPYSHFITKVTTFFHYIREGRKYYVSFSNFKGKWPILRQH